jgi:hypothetical protein
VSENHQGERHETQHLTSQDRPLLSPCEAASKRFTDVLYIAVHPSDVKGWGHHTGRRLKQSPYLHLGNVGIAPGLPM